MDFLQPALSILEESLVKDHQEVAGTAYQLGRCLKKAGRTKEAAKYFERRGSNF